jgi:hypothetical protein
MICKSYLRAVGRPLPLRDLRLYGFDFSFFCSDLFVQVNLKEALKSLLPESAGPFTPSFARDPNAKRAVLKTKSSSRERSVPSPLMARSSSGMIGSPLLDRKVAQSESSSSLVQFNTMTDLRIDNPLSPLRAAPMTCLEARKQLMSTPKDAVATFQYAKLLAHDGFVVCMWFSLL